MKREHIQFFLLSETFWGPGSTHNTNFSEHPILRYIFTHITYSNTNSSASGASRVQVFIITYVVKDYI